MDKNWVTSKQQYYDILEKELGPTKEISKLLIKMIEKRVDMGITQKELAEKSGLKQSAIARIENFSVLPRLDTLMKIYKVLNLELIIVNKGNDDIFTLIKEGSEKASSKELARVYYGEFSDSVKVRKPESWPVDNERMAFQCKKKLMF